jgi:hypothetical protein
LDGLVGKEDLALAEDYARRAAQKGDGAAVALWAEVRRRRSGNPAEIAQILRDGLAQCPEGPDSAKVGGLLADLDEAWPPTNPQWTVRMRLWDRALEAAQLSANQTVRLPKILLAALRAPGRGGIKDRNLLTTIRHLSAAAKKADFGDEVDTAVADLDVEVLAAVKSEDRKDFQFLLLIALVTLGTIAATVFVASRGK